ncbi:MAG: enoyl-CoA hydratase/isomerase family protein [Humibacter sp.]
MSAQVFVTPSLCVDDLGDGLARLTITREERMNSMTPAFFADLDAALGQVQASGAEALIVTGEGTRAFSAGYDLAELGGLLELTVPQFLDVEDSASGAIGHVHRMPIPVIAAVNGAATGGGLSLALAADIRIAAEHAKLSCAFVKVGFSVGELGTSWMLSRLVGPGFAAELAFTGRLVSSREALERGLVQRVVPSEELQDAAEALGRELIASRRGRGEGGARTIGKRRVLVADELASYRAALASEVVEP